MTLGVQTGDAAPRARSTMTRARITRAGRRLAHRSRVDGAQGRVHAPWPSSRGGPTEALRDAITSLRERGAEALVLDLRGDPGGLRRRGRRGVRAPSCRNGSDRRRDPGRSTRRATIFATDTSPVAGDLPLDVLVDRNSASASEIVAGALRDAKRGTLVGERTFGKALVQSTMLLRDGGALKLTTQRYLTPSGYDLAKRGLPPAVKVGRRPATPRRDEALQKALGPGGGGRMSRGRAGGGPRRRAGLRRAAAPRPSRRSSPGTASPLAKGARGGAAVGDLVTVSMRGRAGRVVAVHGPASSPRAAMRALLASRGPGAPLPARRDRGGGRPRRGRRRRRPRAPRPARPARHHHRPGGREGPRRRPGRRARRATARGGCGCTSPTSRASWPRAARSTARRRGAGRSVYVPGDGRPDAARRGCRPTSAACAPGADRAAVTVEMVVDADGRGAARRASRAR